LFLSLNSFSSSNPSINNNTLILSSYPLVFKDLFSSFITITIMISVFLYWEPDILGNSDNQIIANPLITPNNILPEWYYLLFHSCLRSFPNKTIGVILVLNILIMIITIYNKEWTKLLKLIALYIIWYWLIDTIYTLFKLIRILY